MAPTPVDAIRGIARIYGYEEIQYNETSRVISFRRDEVRINVYYTTGTVATCLNHPHKGKTQLFRRNQTPESCATLFQEPRTHTGAGYYLTQSRAGQHLWTPSTLSHYTAQGATECDDSQRWRYVQAATNFCNPQQASQIVAFCELWNQLRYAEGQTSRDVYEAMSPEVKGAVNFCPNNCGKCGRDCAGSYCSLGQVLVRVALETDPEALAPVLIYSSETNDDGGGDYIPFEMFSECECIEGQEFRNFHSHQLERLERQLMSFPKGIRRELLYFFFKKIAHSYTLIAQCQEGGFQVTDGLRFNTYGAVYLNDAVYRAQFDYGELFYNQGEACQCNCHGCR